MREIQLLCNESFEIIVAEPHWHGFSYYDTTGDHEAVKYMAVAFYRSRSRQK